jgi:hypothetical protein
MSQGGIDPWEMQHIDHRGTQKNANQKLSQDRWLAQANAQIACQFCGEQNYRKEKSKLKEG